MSENTKFTLSEGSYIKNPIQCSRCIEFFPSIEAV